MRQRHMVCSAQHSSCTGDLTHYRNLLHAIISPHVCIVRMGMSMWTLVCAGHFPAVHVIALADDSSGHSIQPVK